MNWNALFEESEVARILPEKYRSFARPVRGGLVRFLGGLPESRQAAILAEQVGLGPSTPLAMRLGVIARRSPVLQKIGQVLARNEHVSFSLRQQLQNLESFASTIPLSAIQETLHLELGPLDRFGITLRPPALAEASVAVVVPFSKQIDNRQVDGVFKILKPGIEKKLSQELAILDRVGEYLDACCDEHQIPKLDYQESFQQVRDKLLEEIDLRGERQKLAEAKSFYAHEDRVQIPELFDCSSSRVLAMQRVWGNKVTDQRFLKAADAHALAALMVQTMIAQPLFARQQQPLFHGDPHAGNLFFTSDGRFAILDWSLAGRLNSEDRATVVQMMLGACTHNESLVANQIQKIAENGDSLNLERLRGVIQGGLQRLRQGQFPGLTWLVSLFDESVGRAGLRMKPDLMMFRKTIYTLEGVVSDVSGGTCKLDEVLYGEFLRHFITEWPQRWLTLPNSREFSTHLSNFDLIQAILDYPSATLRYLGWKSWDFWNDCRFRMNAMGQRSQVV